MRGFLLGAAVLIGLQALLRYPSSAVATAMVVPTAWAERWMNAATPLISAPVPGSVATPASAAGKPATNSLGESTSGQCPPGFPPGLKCAAN